MADRGMLNRALNQCCALNEVIVHSHTLHPKHRFINDIFRLLFQNSIRTEEFIYTNFQQFHRLGVLHVPYP